MPSDFANYDPWADDDDSWLAPYGTEDEPFDFSSYDPWADEEIEEVETVDLSTYDPWADEEVPQDRYDQFGKAFGPEGVVAKAADRGEITIGEEGDGKPWNFWKGVGVLAGQMPSLFTDVIPLTYYRFRRDGENVDLTDETPVDRMIRKNIQEREQWKKLTPEERAKTWIDVKIPFTNVRLKYKLGDLEDQVDQLGYSVVNTLAILTGRGLGYGAAALTGPAFPITSKVFSHVVGAGMGYHVASGAARDEFVEELRNEFLKLKGIKSPDQITPELRAEWRAKYELIKDDADLYGFWEAAPETLGNIIMLGIAKMPVGGLFGKGATKVAAEAATKAALANIKQSAIRKLGTQLVKKLGIPAAKLLGMWGEESFTEALTEMKHTEIDYRLGRAERPISYFEALLRVIPQTILTTTLLGAGMGGGVKLFEKATGKIIEERNTKKLTEVVGEAVEKLPREQIIALRDRILQEAPEHPAVKMIDKALGKMPEGAPTIEEISPESEVLKRGREVHKESIVKTLKGEQPEAIYALGKEYGLTEQEMADTSIDQVVTMVADRISGITAPAIEGQGGGIQDLESAAVRLDKTFKPGQIVEAPMDATRAQAQELSSVLGGKTTFYIDKGKSVLAGINGFYDSATGRVFINANSKNPVLRVLGHEIWHRVRSKHGDLYDNVIAVAKNNEELFASFTKSVNDARKKLKLKELSVEKITEEYIADYAGELFSKPAFWKALNEQNPSFARKVAKSLVKIIEDFRRIIAAKPGLKKIKQPFENMDQVDSAITKAFGEVIKREAPEAKKVPTKKAEPGIAPEVTEAKKPKGEVKFSVKEDPVVIPPKIEKLLIAEEDIDEIVDTLDNDDTYHLYEALAGMQALELRLRAYDYAEPQDEFVKYFREETEDQLDRLTEGIKDFVLRIYAHWLERHDSGEGWARQVLDLEGLYGDYPSDFFTERRVGYIDAGVWRINVESEILERIEEELVEPLPENADDLFKILEDYLDDEPLSGLKEQFKNGEIDENDLASEIQDQRINDPDYADKVLFPIESGKEVGEILDELGWDSPIGKIVIDVMENEGWQAWRANWGKTLDDAEERIRYARDMLEAAETPGAKTVAINLALNEQHVYGTMSEHMDISESDLDGLAEMGDNLTLDMFLRRPYKPKISGKDSVVAMRADDQIMFQVQEQQKEKPIKYAAIKMGDKIFKAPIEKAHIGVVMDIPRSVIDSTPDDQIVWGFVTKDGKFVDREEAARLIGLGPHKILTSQEVKFAKYHKQLAGRKPKKKIAPKVAPAPKKRPKKVLTEAESEHLRKVNLGVDRVMKLAKNAMPTDVVNDVKDLKDLKIDYSKVMDQLQEVEILGEKVVGGAFWDRKNNRVVVIANRFDSVKDALKGWLHEQVGHKGLEDLFKSRQVDFNEFLDAVYDVAKDTDLWTEMAFLYGPDTVKMSEEEGRRFITKEFLAKKAEQLSPGKLKQVYQLFRDFINKWFEMAFGIKEKQQLELFQKKEKIVELKDIPVILEAAKRFVYTGQLRAFEETKFSDQEYVDFAKAVYKQEPRLVTWYSNHQDLIIEKLGKDAPIFNAILAITSVAGSVEANAVFAAQTYLYLTGRRDKPGGRFPGQVEPKVMAMAEGKGLEKLQGKLVKIQEMVRALFGDPKATVNDRWMYRIFFGDPMWTRGAVAAIAEGKQKQSAALTELASSWSTVENITGRHKVNIVTEMLTEQTDRVWKPQEVQAALWSYWKAKMEGIPLVHVADYFTAMNKPSPKFGGLTPMAYIEKEMKKTSKFGINIGELHKTIKLPEKLFDDVSQLERMHQEYMAKKEPKLDIKRVEDVTDYFVEVDPKTFTEARDKNKRIQYITKYTAKQLKENGAKVYMVPGLEAGYAILADGEISNSFNNTNTPGVGALAKIDAVMRGGTHLNCYKGYLERFNESLGFKVTKLTEWDEEFKPDGWDEGPRNVIDMAFVGPKDPEILAGMYEAAFNKRLGGTDKSSKVLSSIVSKFKDKVVSNEWLNGNVNTYNEGVENTAPDSDINPFKNILIQKGEKRGDVVMVQVTSNSLREEATDMGQKYYDTLYEYGVGYKRPADFWEVPQWIGEAAKTFKNADVYVARNIEEAIKFLNQAGYKTVLYSAMDSNKHFIKRILTGTPGVKSIVGGYIDKSYVTSENVKFADSIKDAAEMVGVPYVPGVDYKHFDGTETVPRLECSSGCLHKCAFCTVPKTIKMPSDKNIRDQVASFAGLNYELIYLNDKTFGQAKNFTILTELNKLVKAQNPNFKGFVIQTTAPAFNKLSDEFLKDSGILYVELGVESFNDDILAKINKPHRRSHIEKAVEKIRKHKMNFIPNVMVGLAGVKDGKLWTETAETYQNTLNFLNSNNDIITHTNTYVLAVYDGTDLKDQLGKDGIEADSDENVIEKSWLKDQALHEGFYKKVLDFSIAQLKKKGQKSEPVEPKLEVQGYHGSGAIFEEFDTKHIGTGEGAAAFGWGIYISEVEEIGRHYGKAIRPKSVYLGKDKYEFKERMTGALINFVRHRDPPDILQASMEEALDRSTRAQHIETYEDYMDAYEELKEMKKTGKKVTLKKAQLYKVILHKGKNPGDYDWINWYETPTEKQWDRIIKLAEKEELDVKSLRAWKGRGLPTSDVYWSISSMLKNLRGSIDPDKDTSLFLLDAGIDGIRYPTETLSGKLPEESKNFNYVIFDADAISIEDRISFSLRAGPELSPIGKAYMDAFLDKETVDDRPVTRSRIRGLLYPWKYIAGKSLATGETIGEVLIRKMQDKFIHLKKLQKRLSPRTELEDKIDVYLAETIFSGKTTWQLEQFEEKYVKPLLDKMTEQNIDPRDLDLYLYARHAEERNNRINEINPDFAQKQIPGSGMHTETANAILKKYKKMGLDENLEKFAKIIDKMNDARLKLLLKAGMITEGDYKRISGTYKKYIPLKGKEGEPDFGDSGRGFSIPSTGIRRAMGRKSFAQSPLAWVLGGIEETIVKVNKNEVGKATLGLIREFPDKNLWTIDEITTKQKWDPVSEQVETVRVPAWAQKDVLHVWEDGKRRNVKIKDPLLERALLNVGVEKAGAVVSALARFNRYLAMVNTSLNPEFVLTNFARDIQTAGINITAEQSAELTKKVMKDVPKALRHAYRGYRGKPGIGDWGKWYKLYRSQGGSIGFFGLRGIGDRTKTIETMIKRAGKGVLPAAQRGITELGSLISDLNAAVENAVRLAAFKNAVEAGTSMKRAAALSKNLTVNFNRKGELGQLMNSFYLFYNAGIQGTARVLKVMSSKKGRIIGVSIAGTAFMLTEMNRMLAGDDEEDGRNYYDKIPEYVKERSIILMLPGTDGDYIRFPLPYGYNIFWVIGEQTNSAIHSGKAVAGAINVINAAVDAFNPMGGDSTLIRTLSPTLTDIPLDLYMNQNFAGYPIKPEQPQFGLPKPQSWLYWKSVSPVSKYAAQLINRLTGGNPIRPGKIDISPEVLDYLANTFTGAMGAFINRSLNLPITLLTGKERPIHKTPFQRVFMGEQTEFYTGGEYRKVSEEITRRIEEKEEGLPSIAPDISSELVARYKSTEKNLRSLRKRIKEIENSKLSAKRKNELIEETYDKISIRQKNLIKRFDEEVGGNPWELIDVLNLRKAKKLTK